MRSTAALVIALCTVLACGDRGSSLPKARGDSRLVKTSPRPRHAPALLERGRSVKLNATVASVAAVEAAGAAKTEAQAKATAKAKIAPKGLFALTLTAAFVVKVLCMLSNVLFQVSPFPAVKKFCDDRDTGEADGAPYLSILYGGWQWCFYGTYAFVVTGKSGFLVLVYSNALGAVLGIYYLWGFMNNCKAEQTMDRLHVYFRGAAVLICVQLVAMCSLPCQKALFLCGFVSSLCSVLVSMSMLATVPVIFKTRCSATVNVSMLCIGIGSNMLWLVCGTMLRDLWICIPNTVGLFVFFFSLGLAHHFPRDPKVAAALVAAAGDDAAAESSPLVAIHRTLSGLSGSGSDGGEGVAAAEEGAAPLAARPQNYGSVSSAGSATVQYYGGVCGDTGGTM